MIRLIRGLITNMERKTCKSSAAELRLIRHNKHGRLNANQVSVMESISCQLNDYFSPCVIVVAVVLRISYGFL